MPGKLSGKVALVTGGSRGIGAATARTLAAEGADVAISYTSSHDEARKVVDDIERRGVRGACFQSDQGDVSAADPLVRSVIDQFGRLDILVNNAAIFVGAKVNDLEFDMAAINRMYAVNLHGVIALIRAAARVMELGGRIISLSSNVVVRAGQPGFADYIATKAGVEGFSKGAARDLAPCGISVNVLQSGPVSTDMNPDEGVMAEALKQSSSMARYGKPHEIAGAIAFLAGPDSSYVTGTTLEVDGGINA